MAMGAASNRVLAAAATVLAGCGAPVLTCPARGGPPWFEITTKRLVLRTDLDLDDAREASSGFESIYEAFEELAFPYREKPPGRTEVVVFRDEEEFRAFGVPEMVDGFHEPAVGSYDRVPRAVFYGEHATVDGSAIMTFQHELTHRFVHFYFPQAPPWLDEGLATYFSTLSVRGGVAMLGRPAPWVGYGGLRLDAGSAPIDDVQSVSEAPSVEALLALTRQTFLATPGVTSNQTRTKVVQARYLGAWALVHLLKNGPESYRKRFQAMLDALGVGAKPREAFDRAFAGLDRAGLQRDYAAFLGRRDTTVLRTAFAPTVARPERERRLRDAEVHLVFASSPFRGRGDRVGSARERREIDEALRLEPAWLQARLRSAEWNEAHGSVEALRADVDRALREHPDDPRALYARFDFLTNPPRAADEAELDLLAERLARLATSANALNAVAWYYAGRNRTSQGLPLARRSIELDPSCWECLDTYALLLHQAGDDPGAVDMQTLALNLAPQTREVAGMTARLHQYERAASQARSKPPEGAEPPTPPRDEQR